MSVLALVAWARQQSSFWLVVYCYCFQYIHLNSSVCIVIKMVLLQTVSQLDFWSAVNNISIVFWFVLKSNQHFYCPKHALNWLADIYLYIEILKQKRSDDNNNSLSIQIEWNMPIWYVSFGFQKHFQFYIYIEKKHSLIHNQLLVQ